MSTRSKLRGHPRSTVARPDVNSDNRYERVARQAGEAAASAGRRAASAQTHKEATARRIAELREAGRRPPQRPNEAAERLVKAVVAAAAARDMALAEYERSAAANDSAARAHERAADRLEAADDDSHASIHRREAARAKAAAREDRRVGRSPPPAPRSAA